MALSDYSYSPNTLKSYLKKDGQDTLNSLNERKAPIQDLDTLQKSFVSSRTQSDPTFDAMKRTQNQDTSGKDVETVLKENGQQSAIDQYRKQGGNDQALKSQFDALQRQAQVQNVEKPQQASDIEDVPGANDPQFAQAGQEKALQAQSQGGLKFDSSIPNGYKFNAADGENGLGGQCAWFAEKLTTLPDGKNWTIGSTAQEKAQQLSAHVQNGNAFYKGQDVPQEGNSIVFNGGKYGHVAVINQILPGGKAKVTESNFNNDLTVSHDRIVDLNNPSIMGFMRTKPR